MTISNERIPIYYASFNSIHDAHVESDIGSKQLYHVRPSKAMKHKEINWWFILSGAQENRPISNQKKKQQLEKVSDESNAHLYHWNKTHT